MTSADPQNFQHICRHWRKFRKLSQLDLALAANVSQRHVSWLETGRSHPSRAMIERLSEAMNIPLRERNVLLQAAGYATTYRETALDQPVMRPVLDALNHVLQYHAPLPAIVVDRGWNVKKANQAAELLLSLGGDLPAFQKNVGADEPLNLALLTLHPEGLRQYITNWDQVWPSIIRRLRRESLASGDRALQEQFAQYIELAGPEGYSEPDSASLLPVLPLELDIKGLELSLFSIIATFGTPQDITTDELRIETFYPTDAKTEQFFRNHHFEKSVVGEM
ncbi:helix-turn-helix domain-containing protein [Acaryochloris sp. CCMEE 5410]|uniref:helix-turn-helix domain-containing protein n=1 Tax=Acaryochloris sp. CCMEE 5410 TaxID=310037 RepID=UPI00024852A1|nr:helix-turn-helix transcriptional regulator [Acaryochloris sp. CCMEE 5410]KAI9135183.1 helix-turn-helix transcriptional regulator [Acaryochloris sp. CCMEE 5410]